MAWSVASGWGVFQAVTRPASETGSTSIEVGGPAWAESVSPSWRSVSWLTTAYTEAKLSGRALGIRPALQVPMKATRAAGTRLSWDPFSAARERRADRRRHPDAQPGRALEVGVHRPHLTRSLHGRG